MEASMKEKISNKTKEIEAIIYRYLPEETGYQKTVISAMNYTMKAGGKRHNLVLAQKRCQLLFQLQMQLQRSVQKPRARAA